MSKIQVQRTVIIITAEGDISPRKTTKKITSVNILNPWCKCYDGLHYAVLHFILGPVHNMRKALHYTHFE